jgi:hypothetical protein
LFNENDKQAGLSQWQSHEPAADILIPNPMLIVEDVMAASAQPVPAHLHSASQ